MFWRSGRGRGLFAPEEAEGCFNAQRRGWGKWLEEEKTGRDSGMSCGGGGQGPRMRGQGPRVRWQVGEWALSEKQRGSWEPPSLRRRS